MLLFIKGFLIGLGKIIPGVSGAMLAINFKVYERALEAIINFFDNPKRNFKYLLLLGMGVILAIGLGSKLLLYLFTNYKFVTLMFFNGLIIGGTYQFGKNIKYNPKNIIILLLILTIFLILSLLNINNQYHLKNNYCDNLIFFIGGVIEIFATIVPGISGTSMLMIIGIYQNILEMISNILNITYIINHFNLYLSYGIGMFVSFIVNIYLINYLLKKHKNITYITICGLSYASIIFLLICTFKESFTIAEFIIGIMLMAIGTLTSTILNK